MGIDYDELMDRAKYWVEQHVRGSSWPDYWVDGGRFEGECLPDEFWPHFEKVTGIVPPEDAKRNFYSCSC